MSQSLLEQNLNKLEERRNTLAKESGTISDALLVDQNPEAEVKLKQKLSRYYDRIKKVDTEITFLKDQLDANKKAVALDIFSLKVAVLYNASQQLDQLLADEMAEDLPDLLDSFALSCISIPVEDENTLPDDLATYQAVVLIVSEGMKDVATKINALRQGNEIVIAIAITNSAWKPPFGLVGAEIDFTKKMKAMAKLVGRLATMESIALKQEFSQRQSTEVEESLEDTHWKSLINRLKKNKCIPIIGPDLIDMTQLSERRVVEQLVGETGKYSFDIDGARPLARVLEYLQHVELHARNAVIEELIDVLSSGIDGAEDERDEVSITKRIHNVVDVNALLAQLPCSVYITVNHDDHLETALRNIGKSPQPIVDPYTESSGIILQNAGENTPAVVYLLGRYESNIIGNEIALESEFLELMYEISVGNKKLIEQLQVMFGGNALMFLGFDIHHIAFQTIYWILYPYIERRNDLLIAAPTVSIADHGKPERVSRFLKQYLQTKNMETYININSGRDSTAIDNPAWFLLDLEHKWNEHIQGASTEYMGNKK